MRTSKKKPPKRGEKKRKCWKIQQINQNHMNGMSKSGYSRKMFFYMKKVQPKQKQNRTEKYHANCPRNLKQRSD